jgi:hypothetical protein
MDSSFVQGATEVGITRVDLFFRSKPPQEGNKSGIYKPGVEIKIVPINEGKPQISQVGAYKPTEPVEHGSKFSFYSTGQTARLEWDDIQPSLNAETPTTFKFDSPVFVPTNQSYAAVIKFDGAENFILWKNITGDPLVGQPTVYSSGPSGNFRGTLWQFIADPTQQGADLDPTTYAYTNVDIGDNADNPALVYAADVNPLDVSDKSYLQSNWHPFTNITLKMNVFVSRYFVNGQPAHILEDYYGNTLLTSTEDRPVIIPADANTAAVANGIYQLSAPSECKEYILYNLTNSTRHTVTYGEVIYQDGPDYPGDKEPVAVSCANVTITANGSHVYPNGSTFNATGGFGQLFDVGDSVIVNDDSSNNRYFRAVTAIPTNTEITVGTSFPNTVTGTFQRSPIAFVGELATTTVASNRRSLLTLYNSMANDSVRFVTNAIANATIVASGTGYSNDDYIFVTGYEDVDYAVKGNYGAFANVTTDASGNITAVAFTNAGAGFPNSSVLVGSNVFIYQSSGGTPSNTASAGSGANVTFEVGSTIKSMMSQTKFANCEVVNMEVNRMKPEVWVNNPLGTGYTLHHRTRYYSVEDSNTIYGRAYYVDSDDESANTDTIVKIWKSHKLNIPAEGKTPALLSRSNEFVTRYANGSVNTEGVWGKPFSNTAFFNFNITSNNDYQVVWFDPEVVVSHYSQYLINNDYTNEHTNHGNAVAKHVATRVNLQKGTAAEDVLVYLDAYRPSNTDIKVYARLRNSEDETNFEDLDWTLLDLVDGNIYSSDVDDSEYVEMTFNLPAYPNTDFKLAGTAEIRQGNAYVTGSGTTFEPVITINDGGSAYTNGDLIYFTAPTALADDASDNVTAWRRSSNAIGQISTDGTGNITAVAVTSTGYGWANQSSTITDFNITAANGATSAGSGANVYFQPGLQSGDLIKLYSPYQDWANTNYTTAVVNTVISNTSLTIKRTYGELGVQLDGTVDINTTSTTLTGTGTTFESFFSVGDLIAVWANASVYEVKEIATITSNTELTMDSVGSFANSATRHFTVLPDNFMNNSITVDGLLVDRLAYEHQAFNDVGEDNVARYYNKSMIDFKTFDTMQIKVVLLSDNKIRVPKVDNVRGIMVSA